MSAHTSPSALARRLESTRRAVRRVEAGFPLRFRGLLTAIGAGAALWRYGFGSLDLLLFVIGICGLSLVALGLLGTASASYYLRRKLPLTSTARADLECGSLLRTGFELPSLSRVPLIQIDWHWVEPIDVTVKPRVSEDLLLEEVVAAHRGESPRIVRRISVSDAFGLCRIRFHHSEARPLLLLPDPGRLRHAHFIQSVSGADGIPDPAGAPEGDRMEIRRYAPGDSVRHILWNTFAKTRQLVVRMPERSLDTSQRVIAYLVSGPGDEPAAAAARAALESGALGENWVFGADGTPEPTDKVEDALVAICRSGSRPADAGCGLRTFLERAEFASGASCVVFVPASVGPWTPAVIETARQRRGGLSFIIGTDGIYRARERRTWERLLLIRESPSGVAAQDLAQVQAMLEHAGGRTVIADRSTGRYYGEAHARAIGATA